MRIPDPTRFLPLGRAKRHVLLSLLEGPMHGYGIRRAIEERTGGGVRLAAATLYQLIPRLLREELAEEVAAPPAELEVEATARWRFYRITDLGRAVVRAEAERLSAEAGWARDALRGALSTAPRGGASAPADS